MELAEAGLRGLCRVQGAASAEGRGKDFRDAQIAVAKIDAVDMGELALKAYLSMVYDTARLYYPDNTAVIGFSVALNLIKLTMSQS